MPYQGEYLPSLRAERGAGGRAALLLRTVRVAGLLPTPEGPVIPRIVTAPPAFVWLSGIRLHAPTSDEAVRLSVLESHGLVEVQLLVQARLTNACVKLSDTLPPAARRQGAAFLVN